MNRGLLTKAVKESWLGTLGCGLGLAVLEGLLAYLLPRYEEQLTALWSQLKFMQFILQAFLGTEASGGFGPDMLRFIAWVPPVVLALGWAHATVYCTRLPAGEIDRGTMDVLLSLPVSRWQLYLNESLVWCASGFAVVLLAFAGNIAGLQAAPGAHTVPAWSMLILLVNFFSLYLAVGGVAWFASAASDRRGRAIGIVFAFLVGSMLLNYLANFWSVAGRISFLSVLHYYRPVVIVRGATWPVRDLSVLLSTAAAFWIAAGVSFSRRDVITV